MENQGEIILYQPDNEVKLDVRLEEETVWLTQEQIAILFGTKRPAITKHLSNIYNSDELDRDSTCSILEHMGNDGVKADIYTQTISRQLQLDLEKHNRQYPPIKVHAYPKSHDRFFIIDGTDVYHIGASLKDLGKKIFAFSKMEIPATVITDLL